MKQLIRRQDITEVINLPAIDHMVSGSNPPSAKISPRVRRVASSVSPGVGIARCCQIERQGLETSR